MENKTIDKILKERFSFMPDECYKVLTFGELSIGDKYIGLPIPGDNHGHGGFKGAHYIFEKIEPVFSNEFSKNYGLPDNSKRLKDGVITSNPDTMPVIKIE